MTDQTEDDTLVPFEDPNEKLFRRWLFREVLPEIRSTGTYSGTAPPGAHRWLERFERSLAELADDDEGGQPA
jgi:hypothetical protein